MKCIYCSLKLTFYLHKNGYDIYTCPRCDIKQTDLHESYTSFVKRLYDKEYFTGGKSRNAYTNYLEDKPYIVKNMKQFLSLIRQHRSNGTLLDVGCAMRFFVELALANGFDAYGIDPSAFAVKHAQSLVGSARVIQGTLDTYKPKNKRYDVITMFDVFEHVADPIKTLTDAHALLNPGGLLVIATGDTGSLWAAIAKKHWTFFIPPQHLFFFNRKNIRLLLGAHGYIPLAFSGIGKWLSVEYVLHLAETAAMLPFSTHMQYVAKLLHLHRLPLYLPIGDNMLVIAKKT